MPGEKIRVSGIGIMDDAQWGSHICQFYNTKKDLFDILIPYFKAGLENNEFCIWITSDSLTEKEVIIAMRTFFPDLGKYLKRRQIEIVPHTVWYLKDGALNPKRFLNALVDKLDQALDKGYDGIRISVDTAWLEKSELENFIDYEEEIDKVIGKYQLMAICTYPLVKCDASKVRNVVLDHQFVLIKRKDEWEVIERSRRRSIESTLEDSEEEPKRTPESPPKAFTVPDLNENIVECAQAILDLPGYSSKAAMTGEGAFESILEEDKEGSRWEKKPLKRSFGKSFEDAYLSMGDHKLISDLSESAIPDLSGKGKEFIAGTKDPTERKQLREKLVQSEKLAGIGTLASGIAHGINNPLAGIMGYAEIMMDEKNPKLMRRYAKKIVNEAERASDIIKWLSRYSRQAKDGNITDVDLKEVINESLEALKHTWKSSDIEVIKKYQKIPAIKGNRSELQQIFVNLMDNAMDAMRKGGRLSLSTTINEGCVEVKVTDDGIGIPNENMKRIFEPFFTTKEEGKGTGLGLYVTSMIVKKHHGKINVNSEVGKGTTFTLRFPLSEETK